MKHFAALILGIGLLVGIGGQAHAAAILWEDFNSGIPSGWMVVDNEGNGVEWSNIAGSGESGNYTGGTGDAASVSSDAFGAADFDTSLITPTFSTIGFTSASLSYLVNYQNFAGQDFLDVDITTNAGGTWSNLLQWNEDHGGFFNTPGELVNLDLSTFLGEATVNIRWRYYEPTTPDFDWYAQIDDVHIEGQPIPGGQPIPEPSTMLLLGSGLAGMALWRARKGKANKTTN